MTNDSFTTPVQTAFELQRNAIEQSQQALESSVEFQKQFNQAMFDVAEPADGTELPGAELMRTAIHNQLDALEATMPDAAGPIDEVRETIDEQFTQLETQQHEALEAAETAFSDGTEGYDEFVTEYLAAVNEQLDMLLEAHEDIETQTLEAFQQAEEQFERLQEQFEEGGEQFRSQLEEQSGEMQAQFETLEAQFEEQFERFQEQLEEMQARVEEMTAEA